ncbi:hypothetical protein EZS27_012175 [termite gut metagenome]|uniref:Uncharacterized protein n=1 Tax=termite gut metagenome TaxID=433724 RepID=A0A5J4S346_9ZZZZ
MLYANSANRLKDKEYKSCQSCGMPMETKFITLAKENIDKEHICCAFSDKKCKDGYELSDA